MILRVAALSERPDGSPEIAYSISPLPPLAAGSRIGKMVCGEPLTPQNCQARIVPVPKLGAESASTATENSSVSSSPAERPSESAAL